MTQINQTSFLVQKLKGKNVKPGGFKKASQDCTDNRLSAIDLQEQTLPAQTALSSFANLILLPSTTTFEIANESEDDELDGPDEEDDDDFDEEEEDDFDEEEEDDEDVE
jgi:hypothetical protein